MMSKFNVVVMFKARMTFRDKAGRVRISNEQRFSYGFSDSSWTHADLYDRAEQAWLKFWPRSYEGRLYLRIYDIESIDRQELEDEYEARLEIDGSCACGCGGPPEDCLRHTAMFRD